MPVESRGPQLAGRYRVIRRLASGGMGSVLLAEDERLGRLVAVKRLHADSPEETAQRFQREARLGASLNHPNLVSVWDTETDDEGVLIIMEYVQGATLRDELADGKMSPERALSVLDGVAAALDHAHRQGVVHRDVKPGNVLLRPDGVVKLADLGIATAAQTARITRTGTVLGTPSYMAPEQFDGREAGPAADVYALAAVAFQMLCGRKAREGGTPIEIARRVVSEPPPDLREAWPEAPPAVAEVLAEGMALEPEQRPRSAGEFVRRLREAFAQPQPAQDDDATVALATQPGRRVPPREGAAAGAANGSAVAEPAGAPPAEDAGEETVAREARQSARPGSPRPFGAQHAPLRPDPPPPPVMATRRRRRWPLVIAAALLALVAAGAIALLAGGSGEEQAADTPPAAERDPEPTTAPSGGEEQPAEEAPAEEAPAEEPPAAEEATPPAEEESPTDETPAEGSSERSEDEEANPDVPEDPAAGARLNDEGYALFSAGDYEAAIPVLQRSVASFGDTRNADYYYANYNLGASLHRAGRSEEAIPYLERRLEFADPEGVAARELEAARAAAGSE